MSEKRVSVRFRAEGGDRVRAEFRGLGEDGSREFKRIEDQAASTGRVITRVMGLLGAAVSVRELVRYADTWTDLRARVDLATGAQEDGAAVMDRLNDMARRTYSSLQQTTESYLANATALRELGLNTRQQLDFTEALNNAMVVSGARQERAAQISNALSQAMALGVLRGQQLNTVIQNGGRVAELLAQEMGVTVNELRGLGAQGQITGDVIRRALVGNLTLLREEADSMAATLGDAGQLVQNALLSMVGRFDQALQASSRMATGIIFLADNMDRVAAVALAFAGVMAGRYVVSLAAATAATIRQTGALEALRVAMLRFLPAAVIIGLGELIARMNGLTGSAAEARRGIDDLNIALGDEQRALDLLNPALGTSITLSSEQAVEKLREAQARQQNIVAILAEQRALAQSTVEYGRIAREISGVTMRIDALSNTGRDGGIFAPQANRADIEYLNRELTRLAQLRGELLQTPEQTDALRQAEEQIRTIEQAIANARNGAVTFGESFAPAVDGATRTAAALRRAGVVARDAGRDLVPPPEALMGWQAVADAARRYGMEAQDWGKGLSDALTGSFRSAENALADFTSRGAVNFRGMAQSIIADLTRIAARQYILGPISTALSGVLGGLGRGLQPIALPSADRGGWTGNGARTGGLDGRGGFLMMMHPQEQIIDRSGGRGRGQAAGGDTHVHIHGVRDAESFRQSRGQVAADIGRMIAMGNRAR